MSMSVSLSVCSLVLLENHTAKHLCMLPMVVARSLYGGVTVRNVVLCVRMTSCLHIMAL